MLEIYLQAFMMNNLLFQNNKRLKDMFGISGKVLEWFRSYLEQGF